MGLLDIFTGKSAKDAAAANKAEYQRYGDQSLADLDGGMRMAVPELDNAIGAYSDLGALGEKYGRATDLHADALGINGSAGATRAKDAFVTGPGYEWQRDEAVNAAQRGAARFSPGGNEIDAITRTASGLAGQEWGKYVDRLGGYIAPEVQTTSGAAAGRAAGYGAKAGAYGNDAQSRVNVRGNVAGGVANSNTASAQAQMNASSQFWNGLLSLGGNVAKAFSPNPAAKAS